MLITDFKFDGTRLSDLGYMVCSFDGVDGFQTHESGVEISFTKIPKNRGRKFVIVDAQYENVFTTEISFCKKDGGVFTEQECGNVYKWLGKLKYSDLTVTSETISEGTASSGTTFVGTFNSIHQVLHRKKTIGFTATFMGESLFARKSKRSVFGIGSTTNVTLNSRSDVTGFLYPTEFTFRCGESGTMRITNSISGRNTVIKNCSAGETISFNFDNWTVESSDGNHDIYNNFNFVFPRIETTDSTGENIFSFSLKCQSYNIAWIPVMGVMF